MLLLARLKDSALRLRYAEQALAESWTRATLELNIRTVAGESQPVYVFEQAGLALTAAERDTARQPGGCCEEARAAKHEPYLLDAAEVAKLRAALDMPPRTAAR